MLEWKYSEEKIYRKVSEKRQNSEGKIIQNKEYFCRNYSNEKNNLSENNFEGGEHSTGKHIREEI